MAEFDFKDIGVVLGLLGGSAGIAVFKDLFALPKDPAQELADALNSPLEKQPLWIQEQRKKVIKALLSPLRLFLSIFFLLVLVGFAYLILIGPQNVLNADAWGPLAEPLTRGECVLYVLMLIQLAAVYMWLVVLPAGYSWIIILRSTLWLRKRE